MYGGGWGEGGKEKPRVREKVDGNRNMHQTNIHIHIYKLKTILNDT